MIGTPLTDNMTRSLDLVDETTADLRTENTRLRKALADVLAAWNQGVYDYADIAQFAKAIRKLRDQLGCRMSEQVDTTVNLYLVVSEDVGLTSSYEPTEPRHIAVAVAAKNHSQARWLAWKSDKTFDSCIVNMPRFRCQVRTKDVLRTPGVLLDKDVPADFDWRLH